MKQLLTRLRKIFYLHHCLFPLPSRAEGSHFTKANKRSTPKVRFCVGLWRAFHLYGNRSVPPERAAAEGTSAFHGVWGILLRLAGFYCGPFALAKTGARRQRQFAVSSAGRTSLSLPQQVSSGKMDSQTNCLLEHLVPASTACDNHVRF